LARDAWMFIVPLMIAMAVMFVLSRWFGNAWLAPAGVLFVLALFCAYFFRDPLRRIPQDPSLLVSPADGRVIEVKRVDDPRVGKNAWKVDIFLNIFNVHIQRSPFCRSAKAGAVTYHPGKFMAADHPKASLDNEQNWMDLESEGDRIQVRQIAGLIARRIACWISPGMEVPAGGKLGLIRFGSQVDLILPANAEILVKPGQRLTGGESPVARLLPAVKKAAAKKTVKTGKALAAKPKPKFRVVKGGRG
jgi:phosphatidylserine decarboxylase